MLGNSTTASQINFPPVTAGPGYILPDSPFYILDKASQQVKLALAFSSQRRAEIHEAILGERVAEFSVMAARNNNVAMDNTLTEVAKEAYATARNLANAKASGENVGDLAKNINDTMQEYRDILKTVSSQANDELALNIDAAREALLTAKVKVEDSLNEQQLAEAVDNDFNDEVESQVLGAETSATMLEKRIAQFEKRASKAGELKDIVEQNKKDLKEKTQKVLEEAKLRRQKILEERKKKLEAAKEAAKKAKEAAQNFREARQKEQELRKTSSDDLITPTITQSSTTQSSGDSSGNTNKGSGSTNSGSSGSSGKHSDDK